MSEQQCFIQLNGEVLGPISHAELCDLALRGSVQPQTLVSADRAPWARADSIIGLAFKSPPPVLHQAKPQAASSSGIGLLIVGLVAGGLVAACGGVFLLVLVGLSEESSDAALVDQSTPTREQIVAETTLAYWQTVGQVLEQSQPADSSDSSAAVATWRSAAAHIRGLPTRDVDQDAIQCGLNVATALGNLADFVEQSNSPAMLVEAFVRGAAGDPFGTSRDLLEAQKAVQQQLEYVDEELYRARAILSSRYGIEFPPL